MEAAQDRLRPGIKLRRLLFLALCVAVVLCLARARPASAAGSTTLTQLLPSGWSLVSVPLAPVNPAPTATFADLPAPLRVYARADGLWAGVGEPDFTGVVPGRAYWVLLKDPVSVRVTGDLPAATSPVHIPLTPGWNLIGPPWPEALAWSDARISVSDGGAAVPLSQAITRGWLPDTLQSYSTATGSFTRIAANSSPAGQLLPWHGYLLYSEVTGELLVAPPPADHTPPAVALATPTEDAELTGQVRITGTASDDHLLSYTLEYAIGNADAYIPFATGTAAVTNGALGTLDTALLPNGIVRLRLTAIDAAGNTASSGRNVLITGQQKSGNFTVTFQDLTVPVSGIPITIRRTYDSRARAEQGDFGFGWKLDVASGRYTNNRKPGDGWVIRPSGGFFKFPCTVSEPTKSHISEIRLSDTEIYRFALQVNMYGTGSTISGGCLGDVTFRPSGGLPGATLAVTGGNAVFWQNGTDYVTYDLGDERFGEVYEPSNVRLTTRDGRQIDLTLTGGVTRIQDANGNGLTLTAGGVAHSSGKGVIFTRDSQGRITAITDPLGQRISYTYDAAGNLTAVTDRAGSNATFTYGAGHLLRDIIDPLGNRSIRSEYDSNNRLVATIDSSGNRRAVADDPGARQTVLTDRRGNATTVRYDAQGNILSKTDALGNAQQFAYDAHGNALTESDAAGNTTTATYDAQDNLLTTTDPLGNRTTYTYNSRGQVLSIRDARGNTSASTYDAKGNLVTTTDALGNITRNTYDAKGNRTSTTDGAANIIRYEYDAAGNVTRYTDAAGHVTTYTYDANGNQLSEAATRTDATGALVTETKRWAYDGAGRVTAETDALGNTTRTEYTATGQVLAVTDPGGNRVQYRYDAASQLVETRYPDGTAETAAYDVEGNRTSVTDRAGRTTTYAYDAANRLIRTGYPDGSAERREYDAAGRLRVLTDENGHPRTYQYDALGHRTLEIDALGNETRNTYDAAGNRISSTDANGNTVRYDYDAANRLTRTRLPDGTATSSTYDGAGRKLTETDQRGNVTTFSYTRTGQLAKVRNALGGETSYSYDEVGNLFAQTDADGSTNQWPYDALGRPVSHTLPLGMTERFTYDADGNMLSHTDFNGQTTVFAHDTNKRLVRKSYPGGTAVTYTYTATGQVATATDSRGVTRNTYDLRDRLVSVANPDGATVRYSYDPAGNRTAMQTSSGTTAYAYDAANRLISVTDPGAGATAYSYDRAGNQLTIAYPNGTEARHTYDVRSRLTGVAHVQPGGTLFLSQRYTLDAVGNRVRVAENMGRTVDYGYDALSRLTEERITDPAVGNETIRYTYDAVGNRLTKADLSGTVAYSYDANDRLTTEGSVTYAWDRNGNTTARTDSAGTATLAYDFENRLISVQAGGNTAAYTYDHAGSLVRSTVNGAVTDLLVDGNRPLAQVLEERGAGGALLARYVYGQERISREAGGATAFYHHDGLGSTRGLTDSSHALTASYTYDAFGNLRAATGSGSNPFLFAGERFDATAGLYHLRARHYDPAVGRFTARDPFEGILRDPMTRNPYLYARANPVNLVDPSGRFFGLAGVSLNFSISISLDTAAIGGAAYMTAQVLLVAAKAAVIVCAGAAVLSTFTAIGGPCDVTRYNVFYPGMDTPQSTQHIADALATNRSWANLKRISPGNSRSWLSGDPRCAGNIAGITGLWCDEYPFASSEQGGPMNGASLRLVPAGEQMLQGGKLGAFYGLCRVKPNDSFDGWFGVVPTGAPISAWTCK